VLQLTRERDEHNFTGKVKHSKFVMQFGDEDFYVEVIYKVLTKCLKVQTGKNVKTVNEGKLWNDLSMYPIMMTEEINGQIFKFQVGIDEENKRFTLVINDYGFYTYSYMALTMSLRKRHAILSRSEITLNGQVIKECGSGDLFWNSGTLWELRNEKTVGWPTRQVHLWGFETTSGVTLNGFLNEL